MAQLMAATSDIVVHGADESLLALVLIRNWNPFSAEDAVGVHRDLIARGEISPWARFVLIVSQETGYLWRQDRLEHPDDAPPLVSFPMTPVIERYLPSFVNDRRLTRFEMRMPLTQWLWAMAIGFDDRPGATEDALNAKTDFVQLMKGAKIKTDDDV